MRTPFRGVAPVAVALLAAAPPAVASGPLPTIPTGILAAHGALWVAWLESGHDGRLRGVVERRDPVRLTRTATLVTDPYVQMAAGPAALWVAAGARVTVVDAATARARCRAALPSDGQASGIAVAGGAAAVITAGDERVIPLDARRSAACGAATGRWVRPTGRAPIAVAASRGAVWVTVAGARRRDGTRARGWLVRLEPRSLRVTGRVRTGRWPPAVVVGGGRVWVVDAAGGTITRVDPRTMRADPPVAYAAPRVHAPPVQAAYGRGRLWVVGSDPGFVVTLRPRAALPEMGRLGRAPIADVAAGSAGADVLIASAPRSRVCRITDPPVIRIERCASLRR